MTIAHHGIKQSDGNGDGGISVRYWRFRNGDVTWIYAAGYTVYGAYHINLYEIDIWTSADCSGTPIPVSAVTTSTNYSISHTGAQAIDNNIDTFWSDALGRSSSWICLECGSAVAIGSFSICRNIQFYGSQYYGNYWKKIIVEYSSNGTDWTQLLTVDTENTQINQSWEYFTNLQG